MKKIIKRIVDRIRFSYPIMIEESLTKILEEELPDFQRIDWERLRDCFYKASNGYVSSHLSVAVNQYNSTLSKAPAQPPALVPLPKEMPKWFAPHMTRAELWDEVVNNYGTPEPKPEIINVNKSAKFTSFINERGDYSIVYDSSGDNEKIVGYVKNRSVALNSVKALNDVLFIERDSPTKPNIPSVEELGKEMFAEWNKHYDFGTLAQKLHDKYALNPREWWQDLKEGDKFMRGNDIHKFSNINIALVNEKGEFYYVGFCTPYTPPSAQDIIAKHNLSEEEIRAIREGKCT